MVKFVPLKGTLTWELFGAPFASVPFATHRGATNSCVYPAWAARPNHLCQIPALLPFPSCKYQGKEVWASKGFSITHIEVTNASLVSYSSFRAVAEQFIV